MSTRTRKRSEDEAPEDAVETDAKKRKVEEVEEEEEKPANIEEKPVEESLGTIKPKRTDIVSKKTTKFDNSAYMAGVFAYQREDYKTAIKKFSSLKIKYASEKTAENILYWMADSYQQDNQFAKALRLLSQITSNGKLRIDDALIQKGLLHRKMGNEDKALLAFTNVVSNHPKSEYIRLAQLEIKKSDGIQ